MKKYQQICKDVYAATTIEKKKALALELTELYAENKANTHRTLINKQTDPDQVDKIVGMILRAIDQGHSCVDQTYWFLYNIHIMNEHMTPLEYHPTAMQRISAFWGDAMFFKYVEGSVLVTNNGHEAPFDMEQIKEIMFLVGLLKIRLEINEIEKTNPWGSGECFDTDELFNPNLKNSF